MRNQSEEERGSKSGGKEGEELEKEEERTGHQTKKFGIFMLGIISVRRRYLGGHR